MRPRPASMLREGRVPAGAALLVLFAVVGQAAASFPLSDDGAGRDARLARVAPQPFAPDTLEVPEVTGMEALSHGELLPPGQLTLSAGWSEPPGASSEGDLPGSGNQTYFGGMGWGALDRVTLLFGVGMNGDPTYAPVRGLHRDQYHFDVALGARMHLADLGGARLGLQATGEVISLWNDPGLFNTGERRDRARFGAFSLELPLTLASLSRVRASLIPSVARLPDRVMGARYFGTVFRLGARMDARVADRWTLWGTAELPFGPGESTLDREGELSRLATWRAGLRYRATDRVALEATATNSSEATPATRHLTQLGAPVTLYTLGFRYAPTVAEPPDPAASKPDAPLEAIGGVTVPRPATVPGGRGRLTATLDTEGAVGVRAAWAFGRRIQFELLTTRIRGPDAPAILEVDGPGRELGDAYQYRFGPQILVLDQADGAPVSAAGRLTVGRDVDDQQGYLLVEGIVERVVGSGLAVVVDPVVIESGGRDLASVGFGARVGLGPLTLLPEARASLTGEAPVWSLGVRSPAHGRLSADLFVTNAGSTLGVGRLLADPGGMRVGLTVNAAL